MMELLTNKNYKWIYTYDYAPGSLWEVWREADVVPSWIDDETDRVAQRVDRNNREAGIKMPCFLLLADSHFAYNGTWDDTVACLRALNEKIEFDGLYHLGDITDGWLPLEETRKNEAACISDMRSLGIPVHVLPGNHDYNYFRRNPEICYPKKPQFYIDYPADIKASLTPENTKEISDNNAANGFRIICIDSFDPKETVRYGFTDYCIHWLEAALRSMPEGYSAIIMSHVPPLVRLQVWAKDIRNREKLIAVLNQYADHILAFINGHNHCDHLFNDLNNGQFPIISINCAKCEYFTDHKPEGAVVPERRLGDRSQESFDVMQVDAENGRIYFTRFGAGSDRLVREHKAYWK